MTTLEILKAARELISAPERWTQETSARTPDGRRCGALNANAVCWCSTGATLMFDPDNLGHFADSALGWQLMSDGYNDGVERFNDTHTHAEVLALFDKTIARLESGASHA